MANGPADLTEMERHFEPSGVYLGREGPAHAAGQHCNKKLCLVATDRTYLASLLLELSRRRDCFWVKYSPVPRDGMHLGRVFLTDALAIGALWARLKADPKILCSIQDDDFTALFRAEGVSATHAAGDAGPGTST